MVAASLWGYASTLLLYRQQRRLPDRKGRRLFLVWISVSLLLLLLILFKYLNFIFNSVNAGPETRDLFLLLLLPAALPAGISFYTPIIVAYVIDVADEKIQAEPSFVKFVAYIWMFPHLIAGPILRYEPIKAQLDHVNAAERLRPA